LRANGLLARSGGEILTHLPAWLLVLGCLSSACTSQLELSLDGKQCQGSEGHCVRGFVCERQTNLCVRPDQLASASAGAGQGGARDASGGQRFLAADSDGGPLVAAAVGTGGAAGSGADAVPRPQGGAASSGQDAGETSGASDAAVADACVPSLLYPDTDGDGVGLTSAGAVRCPEPGWVGQAGDCRDDQERVFLGQGEFSALPFPDPTKPEGNSFDFDCSGSEQPDPGNSDPDPPPEDCTLRVPCNGRGYLPAMPARSGPGVEPRCGSNRLRRCVATAIVDCAPEDVLLAAELAFRCR
jgi:hypothetical protein